MSCYSVRLSRTYKNLPSRAEASFNILHCLTAPTILCKAEHKLKSFIHTNDQWTFKVPSPEPNHPHGDQSLHVTHAYCPRSSPHSAMSFQRMWQCWNSAERLDFSFVKSKNPSIHTSSPTPALSPASSSSGPPHRAPNPHRKFSSGGLSNSASVEAHVVSGSSTCAHRRRRWIFRRYKAPPLIGGHNKIW